MDMYNYLKRITKGETLRPFPLTGETDAEESVFVSDGYNDGMHYFETETVQNNGWLRVNVWYEDGSSEEWYER